MMHIHFTKEEKKLMMDDLQYFYEVERGEELGYIAAEQILDFMLEKIAPTIYNKGVEDARERVEQLFGGIDEDLRSLKRVIR